MSFARQECVLISNRDIRKIVSRQAAKSLFLNHFATLRLCVSRTFGIIRKSLILFFDRVNNRAANDVVAFIKHN